jgi:hypothetical protein
MVAVPRSITGRPWPGCADATGGANGYIAKDADLEFIRDAARRAAESEFDMCPLTSAALIKL